MIQSPQAWPQWELLSRYQPRGGHFKSQVRPADRKVALIILPVS